MLSPLNKPKFEDAHIFGLKIGISLLIPIVNMCYLPSWVINGRVLGVQPLLPFTYLSCEEGVAPTKHGYRYPQMTDSTC